MRLRILLALAAVPLSLDGVLLAQPTDSLAVAEAEAEAADRQDAKAAAPVVAPSPAVTGGYSALKPAPAVDADPTQPRRRLVTVFGTEPCPKPSSPDEVVVCARLPDSEQYRIPQRLRQPQVATSPFQANRALLLGDASAGLTGAGAVGSCSAIGPATITGCAQRDIDAWAADRSSRMGSNEPIPPN
jgi:hypothetical protein